MIERIGIIQARHGFGSLGVVGTGQDGFHPTPTSDFADLVLPAAIWGEKEGTYTNSERRVSKANQIVTPPGEARSDFDIFLDLAERMSVRQVLYPGWSTTKDAFL